MRRLVLAVFAAVSLAAVSGPARAAAPARYDSLLLSLSWSPTWCAGRHGHSDREQCAGGKDYAFVLHGLWPRYARGVKHRRRCLTATEVPAKVAQGMLPMMPSHKLIEHEWETHGACVDPDPAAYFAKARAAWDKVAIPSQFRTADHARTMTPDQIRQAFVAANPGLPANAVAVSCHMARRRGEAAKAAAEAPAPLNDVRFCLDRDLKFHACPASVRDRCPDSVVLPAAKSVPPGKATKR